MAFEIPSGALLPSAPPASPKEPLAYELARPLSEADWLAPKGAKPLALKSIRASHHQLARLLSEGHSDGEVSVLTGYCTSRISILKSDPAFRELMEFYQRRQVELSFDASERLKVLTLDTLEVIHERVREEPESLKLADLREVAEMGLDRTGLPKATKALSVNVSMSAEELRELRESLNEGAFISRGEFLSSITPAEAEAQAPDRQAEVGAARGASSGDAASTNGGPEEGEDV